MNFKIAFIVCLIILFGVLGWALYVKIIQPSESQKAKAIINYTFEPHQTFFGCANYKIPQEKEAK